MTGTVLFFPLFFWVAYTCFGRGRLSLGFWRASFSLERFSVVLLASMQARIRGLIGNTTLIVIQVINPFGSSRYWLATVRTALLRRMPLAAILLPML